MLVHVEIVQHLIFFKFSLLRQGEASKDKTYDLKTPRSVSKFWIFAKFL